MSWREYVPGSASLLAHLNLLMMLVGGACMMHGTGLLSRAAPDLLGELEQLWVGAGAALVALGVAHWLLAELAVGAAISPSSGLYVLYAVLMLAVMGGEGGWLGWSVVTLRSAPHPDLVLPLFGPLKLIFGVFFPGNYDRIQSYLDTSPMVVYLTYMAAPALLLLQLVSFVAALCAACSCDREPHRYWGGFFHRGAHPTAPPPYP